LFIFYSLLPGLFIKASSKSSSRQQNENKPDKYACSHMFKVSLRYTRVRVEPCTWLNSEAYRNATAPPQAHCWCI